MTTNRSPDPEPPIFDSSHYWDRFAADFDDEPDHGLRDPAVRAAWIGLLKPWLPEPPTAILDVGCGTGSLSQLLAGMGHRVTGIDFSPGMLAQARAKARAMGTAPHWAVMDASFPGLSPGRFDLLICRHVLWALPSPGLVLQRWAGLLKPRSRLLLVEGYWGAGGLHAKMSQALLPPALEAVSLQDLSPRAELWGRAVADERYLLIAERAEAGGP